MMHPFMTGGSGSARRRFVYGHGNRWVTAPPPYQAAHILPPELRRLPFELLRSHSYPRWPHRYQAGIREWQQGGQGSVTFLPAAAATHPYVSRGVLTSGANVISNATRQLAELQQRALGKSAAGMALNQAESLALFRLQRMPTPVQRAALRVTGRAQALPPFDRSGPPPEVVRFVAALNQPGSFPGRAQTAVADPATRSAQIQAIAHFDPIRGR